jgi:hypothetical protein
MKITKSRLVELITEEAAKMVEVGVSVQPEREPVNEGAKEIVAALRSDLQKMFSPILQRLAIIEERLQISQPPPEEEVTSTRIYSDEEAQRAATPGGFEND